MTNVTAEMFDSWADDRNGPVALHLRQKLLPVEGEGAVIFPPTYADIGYNIDTLADGTKVCTIDSVGSQANRIEPMFKIKPYANLVPQIEVIIHSKNNKFERRSLFELPHRSADSVVHASPTLAPLISEAYSALRLKNNSFPLACIAPTSLVFGAWDSRGGSGEKRPRLIRSIIRAWDVDVLSTAAQFNSVWKCLSEDQKVDLNKDNNSGKLSEKGFKDAPATFRKVSANAQKSMPEYKSGAPNPDRRALGGVFVNGSIQREVTVNLVALRNLFGATDEETAQVRRYILALVLLAAIENQDFALRSGCQLQVPSAEDEWRVVPRRGSAQGMMLSSDACRETLLDYALNAVAPFKDNWPTTLLHNFDVKAAKKLLAEKDGEASDED